MKNKLSPREVMPLEIGAYLQDTAHLNTVQSGAYLHLLMHYWLNGPLPDDDERLARMAKCTTDTWRINRSILLEFFSRGQDGRWHQAGADRRREEVFAKYKKVHDDAVKSVNARWAKYREIHGGRNLGETADTVVSRRINVPPPARFPSEVSPHTPFPRTLPNPPQKQPHRDNARADAVNLGLIPGQGQEAGQAGPETDELQNAKQNKGENDLNAPRHAAETAMTESIQPRSKNAKKAARSSTRCAPRKLPDPVPADPRFEMFRGEIFRFWAGQNPGASPVSWTHHETVALSGYLELYPNTDLGRFRQLLRNRAASEENPRARPARWIRDLEDFAGGPLDRFKKQKRGTRQL